MLQWLGCTCWWIHRSSSSYCCCWLFCHIQGVRPQSWCPPSSPLCFRSCSQADETRKRGIYCSESQQEILLTVEHRLTERSCNEHRPNNCRDLQVQAHRRHAQPPAQAVRDRWREVYHPEPERSPAQGAREDHVRAARSVRDRRPRQHWWRRGKFSRL